MRLPTTGLVATQILVACGTIALILLAHGGWWGFAAGFDPACLAPVCDFQKHYVPTAATIFEEGRPTWGYVYPATLAVLAWPLTLGSVGTLVWSLFLVSIQLILAVLPPHLVRDTPPRLAVAFSGLSMLGIAGLEVLSWGQVSGLLVLTGLLAFHQLERRPVLAGGLIGAAIAIKVYPAILLPWLLARGRVWAAVGVLTVGGALGLVLPLLVLGPWGMVEFHLAVYAEIQRLIPDFQRSIGPQSAVSVAERTLLGGPSSLRSVLTGVFAVVGIAQLGLLWPVARRRGSEAWLWAFVVTYGTFPLFLASSWLHYFVHLPLVWLLLGRVLMMREPTHRLGISLCMLVSVVLGIWPMWVALGTTLYPALGVMLASHLIGMVGLVLVLIDEELVEGTPSPVDTPAMNR